MILLFAINLDFFDGYMNILWIDGTGGNFTPTLWGWILITILFLSSLMGFYFLYIKQIYLCYTMGFLSGILLQLILNGVYVKIIW